MDIETNYFLNFCKNDIIDNDVVIKTQKLRTTNCLAYLTCIIDNKLTFNEQAKKTLNKAAQRQHFVYQFFKVNVDRKLIRIAYDSMV